MDQRPKPQRVKSHAVRGSVKINHIYEKILPCREKSRESEGTWWTGRDASAVVQRPKHPFYSLFLFSNIFFFFQIITNHYMINDPIIIIMLTPRNSVYITPLSPKFTPYFLLGSIYTEFNYIITFNESKFV